MRTKQEIIDWLRDEHGITVNNIDPIKRLYLELLLDIRDK